jgi:GNAT superfamily N-acetyltransferase
MALRSPSTMNRSCEVRPANTGEVQTIVSILEEVALWTSSRGLSAWDPGFFAAPDGPGQESVRRDVTNRTAYLICCDEVPVGTFALRPRDEVFWPDAPDDALYLHRFAVLRAAAGIGRIALEWIIEEARRQDRAYVRLDCHAQNQVIRSYYAAEGFSSRGDVVVEGMPYGLYERNVDHTARSNALSAE